MAHWNSFVSNCRSDAGAHVGRLWRLSLICSAVLATVSPASAAPPTAQQDPELRAVVQQAIGEAQCFADKYDSAVWYTLMEPKLRRYVKDDKERLEILQ